MRKITLQFLDLLKSFEIKWPDQRPHNEGRDLVGEGRKTLKRELTKLLEKDKEYSLGCLSDSCNTNDTI